MNTTKTIVLMVGLTVLLVFLGGGFGGRQGMIMAFTFAMAMNMFSYWFSDKMVLRMYNAQEVTEAEAPMLWGVTHDLALKMNVYQRIALVTERAQSEAIEREVRDRFGPLPEPVENLFFLLK